jgi:hypothetical protein
MTHMRQYYIDDSLEEFMTSLCTYSWYIDEWMMYQQLLFDHLHCLQRVFYIYTHSHAYDFDAIQNVSFPDIHKVPWVSLFQACSRSGRAMKHWRKPNYDVSLMLLNASTTTRWGMCTYCFLILPIQSFGHHFSHYPLQKSEPTNTST